MPHYETSSGRHGSLGGTSTSASSQSVVTPRDDQDFIGSRAKGKLMFYEGKFAAQSRSIEMYAITYIDFIFGHNRSPAILLAKSNDLFKLG